MRETIERLFARLISAKEHMLQMFFDLPGIRWVFEYITPNQLCYFRIFAAIIMMWLFMTDRFGLAFTTFIVAAFTDFIDGPLARWKHQITEEGKNLDPIADKVLISIPLLLFGVQHFDKQAIAFFLVVELLLVFVANALKPYLRSKFEIPLSQGSNAFGQIKMTTQTLTVGVLLYNPLDPTVIRASETLLWISIAFGVLSFLRHLARMDFPVEDRKKRIISPPNLITLVALFLCVPATFALVRGQFTFAFWLLAIIFFSDWIDGVIARRYDQMTYFGAALDPIRDFCVRFLLLLWFLLQMHDTVVLTLGLSAAAIEIIAALINIRTARRNRTVSLVTSWGKARGCIHVVCFMILLGALTGMYVLPQFLERILFGSITFASLVALLSYYGQQQRLRLSQNQTAGQR